MPNRNWRKEGSDYNVETGGFGHYRVLGDALTGENFPIVGVGWQDATAYATWLAGKTGKSYRLLSEAEWEYAARAGTTGPFSFALPITPAKANYNGNYAYEGGPQGAYREKTVPVKSFAPNAWGLYQVHGNVWEWVQDCWNKTYVGAPSNGSAWEGRDCGERVRRGGTWDSSPYDLRSAMRFSRDQDTRGNDIGFRVARTLGP